MNILPSRHVTRDPFLIIAALLCFLMLAGLGIARYQGYNAGMFDLGNMSQAIWSATEGKPLLYSRPEGLNASRLGGHVELFYLLLAMPYTLWPDPRLLVVIQAALFALGALPVYRLALRRTGLQYAARCLSLIYLLYPTALTSVLFDLHGDTLALPLVMFALEALDARAWRRYALFLVLALLCKFYVAIVVAGIGAYLFLWGNQRRIGAITVAAGVLYGLLAFLVIRPAFLPPTAGNTAAISTNYVNYYFGELSELGETLAVRMLNAVVIFGPVLLVAWRGWRWLLPGLPIAAAALISTGPGGAFDYRYHHYALVVPCILMAAIDGVARMQAIEQQQKSQPASKRSRSRRSWRGDLGLTTGVVVLCATLLVDTPLNPLFWLRIPGYGLDPSIYGITARDSMKDRFLAEQVPADAPIAASNFLAAHLSNRDVLYLTRYPEESKGPELLPTLLPQVSYVVADALFDFYLPLDQGYAGGLDGDREAIALLLRDQNFGLTTMRDGLLLFERGATGERVLANTLSTLPDNSAPAEQTFGEEIALVQHTIEQTGPRRLRVSFRWRLLKEFKEGWRFVAVSRLAGIENARFVHLPSYAIYPAWQWKPGELVEETFEIELPPESQPGEYAWHLGWYSVGSPYSALTDERSRLPDSEEAVIKRVQVE